MWNPCPQVYSCRLELGPELGGFGTNGKGRTEEYALASCYAEFMERLQNGLYAMLSRTMLSFLRERHGFYYNPRERYLNEAELRRLPAEIVADLMHGAGGSGGEDDFISVYSRRLRANGFSGAVSLPFYDTMNRRVVHLPRNLLLSAVGSNGMAAGNTIGEALFQALCEVNERRGAAEVFCRRLTPPSVPEEYLQIFTDEHRIISRLRDDTGYQLVVKDFSAGLGIPVLGLLVIDRVGGRYRLAVGSDTSFQDALSRCITEMFQGWPDQSGFFASLLDMPEQDQWFFQEDTDSGRRARAAEFSAFTRDGTGRFPTSLFTEHDDYRFDPQDFDPRDTHEEEVRNLIAWFHASGNNVYLHDCSFLGFPSVLVYIPEVSSLLSTLAGVRDWRHMLSSVAVDEVQPLMLRLEICSAAELRRVSEALEQCPPEVAVADILQLTLSDDSSWRAVTVAYLSGLIRDHLGQVEQTGTAFESIGLPTCPNCTGCRIRNDCLTRGLLRIADTLYPLMKDGMPDQNLLARL